MVRGRGLSWSLVVAVAAILAGLSYVLWRLWTNDGRLIPPVSWVSAALMVAMAALVISAGLPVRRFLRGRATHPLNPLRAARSLVLAQAAALTGAAVLGWYAGQLAVVLPDLELVSYQRLVWRLVAVVAAAGVLIAAGLVTQRWCRVEPPEEADEEE